MPAGLGSFGSRFGDTGVPGYEVFENLGQDLGEFG
jgi:hypothetical protein